jgi:hypothetical protein
LYFRQLLIPSKIDEELFTFFDLLANAPTKLVAIHFLLYLDSQHLLKHILPTPAILKSFIVTLPNNKAYMLTQ